MNAPFIIEFENHLYPYFNLALLRIALFSNAREGIIPSAIYKLEPHEFGYRYAQISEDELTPKEVELPVQIVEKMIA